MERKTVLILPVLKSRKDDLSKEWFVEYTYRNHQTDKMVRVRVSKGINDWNTIEERKQASEGIIKELTQKLKNGWTPTDGDKKVYDDMLQYHSAAQIFGKKKKSNRTFNFASSKYLKWKESQLKEKSYGSYVSKLRILDLWLIKSRLDEVDIIGIDNQVIKDFFTYLSDDRQLDKLTVEKYRQNLSNFFDWCKKEYHLAENPVHDVTIPAKRVDNAARPIIQFDMDKLLDAIEQNDPQLYLACLFQYYTAVRPGTELRLLKLKDIDFYKNRLTITIVNAKRTRHETVDIPKQLSEICIKKYLMHTFDPEFYLFGRNRTPGMEPVGKNTLRNRFNEVRDKLNLPKHYKFYSMKHTGAGKLLESGATISEVQRHLRHLNIQDTSSYVSKHFGERNLKVINHFPDPRS